MGSDPFRQNELLNKTGLSDVKDQVSETTSKVKEKVGQMADTASQTIDQQRQNVADTLGRAASAVHENADKLPGGPKVANLTHSMADGIESAASYLERHDLSGMGKDLMDVCRRYPTQSLVAALAVGFLIGRSRR
jgi:ElaB/YqjD/DUF883 family membrane-anchored ribosome-binding protein